MSNIVDDLTGGFYKKKIKKAKELKENTYSFYIKFDDDEPIELYSKIDNNKSVVFEVTNTNDNMSYLEYACHKTGKKFKMYAEKSK